MDLVCSCIYIPFFLFKDSLAYACISLSFLICDKGHLSSVNCDSYLDTMKLFHFVVCWQGEIVALLADKNIFTADYVLVQIMLEGKLALLLLSFYSVYNNFP